MRGTLPLDGHLVDLQLVANGVPTRLARLHVEHMDKVLITKAGQVERSGS